MDSECTCTRGGFQRMFFRGAGAKLEVPEGLFFRTRTTPEGSSLSFPTKFFSCQPTWTQYMGHSQSLHQSHPTFTAHYILRLVIKLPLFIQSDLQLIRQSRGQSTLEQCWVEGLAQGPNSCRIFVATLGLEPSTYQVPVKHRIH